MIFCFSFLLWKFLTMPLHILMEENVKLWAFWSLKTISWSTKCFLATGQFAYFGWVWYSYCCQNLAVFTEPWHTPAAGSCKTLVLLVLKPILLFLTSRHQSHYRWLCLASVRTGRIKGYKGRPLQEECHIWRCDVVIHICSCICPSVPSGP